MNKEKYEKKSRKKEKKIKENRKKTFEDTNLNHIALYSNLLKEIERFKIKLFNKVDTISKNVKENSKKLKVLLNENNFEKRKGPKRVGIFVDVQNIYYAAQSYKKGSHLDFKYLKKQIVKNRIPILCNAYIIQTSEIDQSNFIHTLENLGYNVKIKSLKIFSDGTAKGDWDMGIAIDIIDNIKNLDVVALISGDGDFSALVKLLKKFNVRVEVYSFEKNLAKELKEVADKYILLNEKYLLIS